MKKLKALLKASQADLDKANPRSRDRLRYRVLKLQKAVIIRSKPRLKREKAA